MLFCSCKIGRGTANRHAPLWNVLKPRRARGTICAPADWRHSVRSARPPARLSTWTNCTTLIGWRYRTKANTPWWCCCKWLIMSGTNAPSVLTSSIELSNSYCLWTSSYSLPRRLHSFLLVGFLFFSLLLLYAPWLFLFSPSCPVVLFALFVVFFFSFIILFFILFFLVCYQLVMVTFGSLILCLFSLSHFSFSYSFSFLLFSNPLACEYFCPWLSATFIFLRISFFFQFLSETSFFFLFLFSVIICSATLCQP